MIGRIGPNISSFIRAESHEGLRITVGTKLPSSKADP